jgi:thiamine pyrophosphokinase
MEPLFASPTVLDTSFCWRVPADAARHATALVLLNCEGPPQAALPALVRAVWGVSSLRLCADGAASRLYHGLARGCGAGPAAQGGALAPAAEAALRAHLPDAIVGDWDSIDAGAEAFYRGAGVALHPQPEDQDSTDLEKCFRLLLARQAEGEAAGRGRLRVVVAGSFGGRLDHTLQNLNCLYRWTHHFHALVMLSEHALAALLPSGASEVRVARPREGPTCGLLPLAGPTTLTTQGLQWDMQAALSQFGGLVSTSNSVLGCSAGGGSDPSAPALVRVHASAGVIWTVNINLEGMEGEQ